MITEKTIALASFIGATAPLATAEVVTTQHHPLSLTAEIELALWVVSGFLSIIMLLLGLIVYFVKDMRSANKSEHSLLFKKIEAPSTGLEPRLSNLEGQHDAAFNAQGCAYDPVRRRVAIEEAISNVFNTPDAINEHRRWDDCPRFKARPIAENEQDCRED